jgi:hypothetical protein
MKKFMKVTTFTVLTALSGSLMAKTASFNISKLPIEVKSLMNSDKTPNLSKVRSLCHNLTDMDITTIGKYAYPKRRKAVKRHIKHLCEDLELKAWQKKPLGKKKINHLFELILLQKSFAQKAKDDTLGMTIKHKIKMGLNSISTPFLFTFKKKITSKESMNLNLDKLYSKYSIDELSSINPKNSPYFTKNKENIELHKRFKELAKSKKIKPYDENMVLLFKSVSDSGSAPKIKTSDMNLDDEWSLKWGDELHTDAVGSRIFAGLGFDVDHPYYREKDSVTLVFPKSGEVETNHVDMIKTVKKNFNINIERYISKSGIVDETDIRDNPNLKGFLGLNFVTFVECAIEGRPDRVKRLGPLMNNELFNRNRRELRGALLAHLWIDNWDTRAENTMMAINHEGKRVYKSTGAFSDLGTSFGVKLNFLPVDFRVGLVNNFSWDILKKKTKNKVKLMGQINSYLPIYRSATYSDMKWMATHIAKFNKDSLKKILEKSGWPKGLQKLYLHKLASRRAQILEAFDVNDPNPIKFDRKFSYEKNGVTYIKDGVLIKDFNKDKHPLGYLSPVGRLRNYGGNK